MPGNKVVSQTIVRTIYGLWFRVDNSLFLNPPLGMPVTVGYVRVLINHASLIINRTICYNGSLRFLFLITFNREKIKSLFENHACTRFSKLQWLKRTRRLFMKLSIDPIVFTVSDKCAIYIK